MGIAVLLVTMRERDEQSGIMSTSMYCNEFEVLHMEPQLLPVSAASLSNEASFFQFGPEAQHTAQIVDFLVQQAETESLMACL
jgi:hypothetical protein